MQVNGASVLQEPTIDWNELLMTKADEKGISQSKGEESPYKSYYKMTPLDEQGECLSSYNHSRLDLRANTVPSLSNVVV